MGGGVDELHRAAAEGGAYRWCLGFTGATLACTVLATFAFSAGAAPAWGPLPRAVGAAFAVDELSAPLLPLVALLHFLTALATARTKMARFSFASMLVGEGVRLAVFACVAPWPLIGLAVVATVPAAFELRDRRKPTRVYAVHMTAFVALLAGGWALAANVPGARGVAGAMLLGAVLVRSGTVPFHLWVADLCENGSFGNALLYLTPLTGAYLAVRLVLPIAPGWVLTGLGVVSLATALYAAGMATVQTDARRFFAFLFLSHAALILVGMELHTVIGLTGALALWMSVVLSLGGLGLTLRALEARLGRLSLTEYRGLYEHSPSQAVCFLLTGLASVGFPGTMGFVATEMLVDGVVEASPAVCAVMVLAGALNGIAILRAYLILFTGRRYVSTVSLSITGRERFAVLTLAALILLGGLVPQPSVASRHKAAEAILRARAR
ncbi:MAG: oxidoreductase [Planctomycetes bacterium]|nr:oxidoreductase [Planctomycetota bacterium]